MAVVIAALLPVFLLIVLGFVLKRTLMRLETQWHGLERLTYYVLLPVLLVQTLVKADLTKVPVAGVGGALLLAVLSMSLLCLAMRPVLAHASVDGPAFASIFQGATRWQTYVALAVSGNLFGDLGLALASVAMVAIIPLANVFSVGVLAHYASAEKRSAGAIVMTVVRNPLIWACAIGVALNVTHIFPNSGMRSPTRSGAPRSPSGSWSPAPACTSKACSARALPPPSPSSSSWF
jgi:malonate transporter